MPTRYVNRRMLPTACAAIVTVVAAVAGLEVGRAPYPTTVGPTLAAAQSSDNLTSAVRQVATTLRPAVVQITSEQLQQIGQFNQPFVVPAGVGSGVIYDAQGHILTNNHVIAGARQLLVTLPDGRSFPGNLVGADPQTDLAVIQVTGDNLPMGSFGDASQLQVGDWVVAIGNALALPGGPTVTQGVVSALGRTVQEPGDPQGGQTGGPTPAGPNLFDVIQTDASINPGNSGGPLANLAGQVIGINTLVAGQAGPGVQAQGIGFAISIATAKPIADQLVTSGRVVHPYVGISYLPLNPAIAAQLGVQATSGVVIGQVAPSSPAAAAGLQPRDVVTAVDGDALTSDTALAAAINAHKVGDTLSLTILRGGQQSTVTVTLGDRPATS